MYNFCTNNCHEFVAHFLNSIEYDGSRGWNMVNLAAIMLFKASAASSPSAKRCRAPPKHLTVCQSSRLRILLPPPPCAPPPPPPLFLLPSLYLLFPLLLDSPPYVAAPYSLLPPTSSPSLICLPCPLFLFPLLLPSSTDIPLLSSNHYSSVALPILLPSPPPFSPASPPPFTHLLVAPCSLHPSCVNIHSLLPSCPLPSSLSLVRLACPFFLIPRFFSPYSSLRSLYSCSPASSSPLSLAVSSSLILSSLTLGAWLPFVIEVEAPLLCVASKGQFVSLQAIVWTWLPFAIFATPTVRSAYVQPLISHSR